MAKKSELINVLVGHFLQGAEEKKDFLDKYNAAKDNEEIDETDLLLGAQKYAEPFIDFKTKQDEAVKKFQGQYFAQFRNHFKKFGLEITEADIQGKSPMEMADMLHEKLKEKVGTGDNKTIQEMLDKANASATEWEKKYNDSILEHQNALKSAIEASSRKEILAEIKKDALLYIKKNNLGGASDETMLRAAMPIIEKYGYKIKEDGKTKEIIDFKTGEPIKNAKGTNIKVLDELFGEAFEGFDKIKRNEMPLPPDPNVPQQPKTTPLLEALNEVNK